MEMKNNYLTRILVALFICVSLSACVRLFLPTSTGELRGKAKTNVQFVIDRDYLDVYRDIKRASACLDYSGQNATRITKSELYRERQYGEVSVNANFGTYILNIEVREKGTTQTHVHVWSYNAGDEAAIKKWALGDAVCPK